MKNNCNASVFLSKKLFNSHGNRKANKKIYFMGPLIYVLPRAPKGLKTALESPIYCVANCQDNFQDGRTKVTNSCWFSASMHSYLECTLAILYISVILIKEFRLHLQTSTTMTMTSWSGFDSIKYDDKGFLLC